MKVEVAGWALGGKKSKHQCYQLFTNQVIRCKVEIYTLHICDAFDMLLQEWQSWRRRKDEISLTDIDFTFSQELMYISTILLIWFRNTSSNTAGKTIIMIFEQLKPQACCNAHVLFAFTKATFMCNREEMQGKVNGVENIQTDKRRKKTAQNKNVYFIMG